MKFNNYQKILITWGVLLAIGYSLSWSILSNQLALLILWTTIGSIGLGVQVWLGFATDLKTILIQLSWIAVVVFGIIFTYLELRYGLKLGLHGMTSGWFFMCSGAMLFTAVLYRFNLSYIILCILYAIAGLIIAFGGFNLQIELYISAVVFLVICLIDSTLERTKLRSGLSETKQLENSTEIT